MRFRKVVYEDENEEEVTEDKAETDEPGEPESEDIIKIPVNNVEVNSESGNGFPDGNENWLNKENNYTSISWIFELMFYN